MADSDDRYLRLKALVVEHASNPSFVHHKWFVTYHLEIVEKICEELCDIYTKGDRGIVLLLAWLHDYEKIIDFDNQYNTELHATRELMSSVGYNETKIAAMAEQINIYNAKDDLEHAKIETRIVSSADAASHLVGPFFSLYWYDNPDKSIEELQKENFRKADVDWDKKITIPEIKAAFADRHAFTLEKTGKLPDHYL